jgi:D-alanyl-lipoteichoic acid acyltransferase DltB (MBOAT superfamily)
MLFNSFEFAIFLPIGFFLYWFVVNRNLKLQNLLIVIASFIFYGWWDWRFLFLIAFSALLDYSIGLALSNTQNARNRKLLLLTSILVNLGFLGFFKYYNFFIESFAEAFTLFGRSFSVNRLDIVLPVGISFYTFQTLSYSLDVYKNKLEPTKNIIDFMAYVSFFPQLVAGPIERATNLLPQFYTSRKFDYPKAVDGMRQILWGLFKKIVIADNCAMYANRIFDNYANQEGSTLMLGAIFFSFQIYCDFSGYSDIAIGTARLFGFNLMRNFAFPYFSRDIAEFWRRWHISLSTWFRDYLYVPLGGSQGSTWMKIRNTFIIFIVSGFWHGANWTFIAWGMINALYFLPLLLIGKNRIHTNTVAENSFTPSWQEFIQMGITFFITLIAWVFFRSPSIRDAFGYLNGLFDKSLFSIPGILPIPILIILLVFILCEWFQRDKQHALHMDHIKIPRALRWGIYYTIIVVTLIYGGQQQEFIYFQF